MSKIIKSVELYFKEGSSDKVYKAEIKEKDGGYIVEIAYGKRGQALTTGSNTPKPVSEIEALKIYNKLVNEKTGKGYKESGSQSTIDTTHLEARDTGFRPQLLNEIDEDEVGKYLTDDSWCAQEKFDGRRRGIIVTFKGVTATNRKGLTVTCSHKIIKTFSDSFNKEILTIP
jgi:bifunctional non-homologous end joining protein LigD